MTDYREVRTTEHEPGRAQRFATFKVTQIIWLLLGLLEAMLALRILFKLVGVNPSNAFATLLYGLSGIFVAPFASLARAPSTGGMVLEVSTIIAMIVYLLIFWAFERVVYVLFYRPRGPVNVTQTSVAEHIPQQQQAPLGVNQSFVSERTVTVTQNPATGQADDTQQTNIQNSGPV